MNTARPTLIDATGAARRLQALACAGYGIGHLSELLVAHRLHVRAWQQHHRTQVHLSTHQRVDYTYRRLWDTEGPSTLARQHAQRRGWQPFEAWTDDTLDDPTAYPYGDPVAVGYVDEVKLNRVRAGKVQYLELSEAEKMTLLAQHLTDGGSVRGFINRHRPVPKRELGSLVQRHPDIWPLLNPDELAVMSVQEVRLEDLRLVG